MEYKGFTYTLTPKTAWDSLSMLEKSEMMKVAVKNGITDLKTIREKYNEFAMGGDKGNNTPRPVTTGGAGYVPSMNQSAYRMVEKVGNLGKAAVKAGTKFIKDIVTLEPDAVRNAGIVYLQNLNPENRKVALDAVMHSSEGAHVMSGDAMLDTGLPNYVRAITGNPIQVNYTGSGIFDESKRDTEDGYYRPNLKRDMVNLYLKGDTTGFEDVTDNPYYQNGPDYRKYFRENYPGLSPKTYKMSSDQVPLLLYPNEYEEAINNIGRNIPVEADGWTEGGDNVGHYNRWYKMIDGKLMAIDSDVWDFNPKDWGWMGGNTDDPELVNSVGTPFILKAIRPVQQIGYNQKPISPNKKHSIGGPIVEAAMNEYKNGGGIHIKDSKKGTFTAAAKKHGKSVQAFASQVLAHPENYSPAMRKKANFARNASHWKHGLGGNLFSGEEEGSQQMDRANIFRRPNGEYFYQASPESEEVTVTPLNTLFDNPALWTFTDNTGKVYKPKQLPISNQDVVQEAPNKNRLSRVIDNYIGELKYDLNNGVPVGGKYTMPAIAAAAALPLVGEATYPVLTNPFVDAGLTSAFAAHGLNHTINEGINGWGDAAMTALEVAPLGRLAKPIYNASSKLGADGVDKVKWLYNEGNVFNAPMKYNPENFYRLVGKDAIEDANLTGIIRANPNSNFKVPYFGYKRGNPSTRVSNYDNRLIIEGSPNSAETWADSWRYDSRRDFIKNNLDNLTSELKTAESPEMAGLYTDEGIQALHKQRAFWNDLFKNKYRDVRETPTTRPLSTQYFEEVSKNRPGWMMEFGNEAFPSNAGSTSVPNDNFIYWQKYPLLGWRPNSFKTASGSRSTLPRVSISTPEITAENVASMTSEQWDAAYKAAVESGNRPEALRLLEQAYLRSGIPRTDITVTPEGHAVGWYHGSEWGNHTIFDSSAMNATIGGTSAHGKVKGNFLTTDIPSAMRYAGSSRFSSADVPEYASPQTFSEKVKNLFGVYKPRRLYPAERIGEYAPKPERMFDTKGEAPINHLDKTDNIVYPLYVNPGEDIMRLNFKGKPWSQSPVKFPNNFYLRRHIRDDVAKTYRDEIVPYKDYETAYKAWIEDPINIRRGRTSLNEMYFDDGIRSIEGFNSAPRYETVRLIEERVPSTTNGAVQTAAKEGKTSVLMRNVIDSNGGPEGAHYAIDDFVTLKPNQQKLADITYDDNGNLIPLSQRFNWSNMDIRYGLIPFGIGLTGYGLFNNQEAYEGKTRKDKK